MVEIGTATAPRRIAPRMPVSNSTPSNMRSITRSSGRTPIAFRAAATAAVSSARSA
jgi:hypothetical protein